MEATTTKRGKMTWGLLMAVSSASLGMFMFGYNTAVINAPQKVLEEFYNASFYKREGRYIEQRTLTVLWAFTVSIFAIGGMIGGVLGGTCADKLGRKKGMLLNTATGIAGALLMGLAKLAHSYEMVIIGRFVIGFNCGLSTGLSPLYNSEVAPTSLRGAIGTVNQLAVTVGMLVSQVLGLGVVLGTSSLWPLLLGLTGVPAVLQLLLMSLCPESPRYLLLSNNDRAAAKKALETLRHADESALDRELEEYLAENENNKLEYQIFYYSTSLFESVGVEQETAQYATLGVGAIMVAMTLVTVPLMDIAGRRTLHLTGLAGMTIFSIVFTVTFDQVETADWLKYLTITSALIIVLFFAIGPGSIPWMIVAEIFSQGPRSAAVSIGVLINWLTNFIVGQTFPPLQNALQELVFIPFTVLLAIFYTFLFFKLPETKNKTIEEITMSFDRSGTRSATVSDLGNDDGETHYKPVDDSYL